MASATREQILQALFIRLQNTPGFNSASRILTNWAGVPIEEQPAVFLTDHDEDYIHEGRNLDRKLVLNVKVFIYARTEGDGVVGSSVVNDLIEAVDKIALRPDSSDQNVCTLGRLVNRCWIEGKVLKDPGDFDGQAMALIPIKILVP